MNKLKSDHMPSEKSLAFSVVFIVECKNNSWQDQKMLLPDQCCIQSDLLSYI